MVIALKGKKVLLVGGLGHTDLTGKVPRPGLLMLRKALRGAGHDATVANYSTSLMDRMFPSEQVSQLRTIFNRTIKPLVVEGKNPLLHWELLYNLAVKKDMKTLKSLTSDLQRIEREVYEEVGYEISQQVGKEGFDAVGLPLYMGSSTIAGITIANILRKEKPNLPIIFGGPQATLFHETIYRHTTAPTALVLGEGEEAIVGFANIIDSLKAGTLDDLRKIPNLVFREMDGTIVATERSRVAPEDWYRLSSNIYAEADFEKVTKYAFIETSRGCLWRCSFCPQWIISGKERYLKPAEFIVDEMVRLYKQFGISCFELVGSTTPLTQAEEIADLLIERGLQDKFSWGCFMRGKDIKNPKDPDRSIQKIKQAGCSVISFGVEAADNPTLKAMRKGETIEEIEATMLAAKRAGIDVLASFIYPYPQMPKNEDDLIIDFLKRVIPISAPEIPLGLMPQTWCFEHAEEIGIEFTDPDQNKILDYLLTFPLILSLPMRFWPPFPYKINGMDYSQYVKKLSKLQKRITKLGISLSVNHSHYLLAQVLGISLQELTKELFYCSLTGDPDKSREMVGLSKR